MTFKQTSINLAHSIADGIRWMDGRLATMSWKRVAVLSLLILIAAHALPDWPLISIITQLAPFFVLFCIILKVEAGSRVKAVEAEKIAVLQVHSERAVSKSWSAKLDAHFLFNAMSTIEYLITINPEVAIKAQSALALYLRSGLSEPDKSTVQAQAKACESYLYIQSIRLAERLRYSTQCSATGPMHGRVAIALLELAISKTIEPKVDGGLVTVECTQTGPGTYLWVMTCPEGLTEEDTAPWRDAWLAAGNNPLWSMKKDNDRTTFELVWSA